MIWGFDSIQLPRSLSRFTVPVHGFTIQVLHQLITILYIIHSESLSISTIAMGWWDVNGMEAPQIWEVWTLEVRLTEGKLEKKNQFLKPRDDGNGVPARRLYDAQHRHGATNIGLGVVLWGWRLTLVGLENCFYQTFGWLQGWSDMVRLTCNQAWQNTLDLDGLIWGIQSARLYGDVTTYQYYYIDVLVPWGSTWAWFHGVQSIRAWKIWRTTRHAQRDFGKRERGIEDSDN